MDENEDDGLGEKKLRCVQNRKDPSEAPSHHRPSDQVKRGIYTAEMLHGLEIDLLDHLQKRKREGDWNPLFSRL